MLWPGNPYRQKPRRPKTLCPRVLNSIIIFLTKLMKWNSRMCKVIVLCALRLAHLQGPWCGSLSLCAANVFWNPSIRAWRCVFFCVRVVQLWDCAWRTGEGLNYGWRRKHICEDSRAPRMMTEKPSYRSKSHESHWVNLVFNIHWTGGMCTIYIYKQWGQFVLVVFIIWITKYL